MLVTGVVELIPMAEDILELIPEVVEGVVELTAMKVILILVVGGADGGDIAIGGGYCRVDGCGNGVSAGLCEIDGGEGDNVVVAALASHEIGGYSGVDDCGNDVGDWLREIDCDGHREDEK
ncbi:hypothetical protein HAX54_036389 [Datura stramonium]|uniref:Uncharacterized protein n=1 Tax=Datura stramonium TaxID=4076 RepID=A0ABS8SG64_DATST|nr:hypothetical protein [Datura stramonium]